MEQYCVVFPIACASIDRKGNRFRELKNRFRGFFTLELHSSQALRSLSSACNLINMESWTCCLSEVTFSRPLEERGFLGQTGCLLNDAEYFFSKSTVAVGNRSELVTARRSVYLFNVLT